MVSAQAWSAVAAAPWETVPEAPPAIVIMQQPAEQPSAGASAPVASADQEKIDAINASLDLGRSPGAGRAPAEEAGDAPEMYDVRGLILQGIIPLCVVVALVLLVYAGLRKLGKRSPLLGGGEHMTCIGRLYLDRASRVHLVRVGGRVLVLGTGGNAVTLLGDMDAGAFDAGTAAAPTAAPVTAHRADSFYDQLQANLARINHPQQPADDADIEQIRTEIVRLKRVLEDEPGDHAE